MSRASLTDGQRAELLDAYLAGEPVDRLSQRFGVHPSYPPVLASKAGIKTGRKSGSGKSWSDEDKQRLADLLRDGLSASEIAAKMEGRSRCAITSMVKKTPGLHLKRKRGEPAGTTRPRLKMVAAPAGNIARKKESRQFDPGEATLGRFETPDAAAYAATAHIVALVDLTARDCRWPIGDPKEPSFGFCGHSRLRPHPYCEAHARRAYPGLFICAEAA